ncbi:FCHO2-like protein [Mya arenaria]|uniref:FCHO2-like protein n=1 Tax=Mya arenaria TaxID=6604 RepID=A0ABY7FPG7_MYAAR|nr:FCHO2-like protein [Mya arenaria]
MKKHKTNENLNKYQMSMKDKKKKKLEILLGIETNAAETTTFANFKPLKGGKNNGFYVLYHNMKHGQTSSKDLMDFLRESTFAPFWTVLKTLSEKLASLHMQLVHTWSDLMKDIVRYNDEQHKKHKSAKEIYHTRCLELERLKRESASPKDIEKSETKYKKAKEEYKNLVDKYATIREDFQTKMVGSCTKEIVAVKSPPRLPEVKPGCLDCLTSMLASTVQHLEIFSQLIGPLEFVEPDLSSLPAPRPMSPEATPNDKRDSLSEKNRADSAIFTDSSGSTSSIPSDQPGPLSRSVKLRQTIGLKVFKEEKKEGKEE